MPVTKDGLGHGKLVNQVKETLAARSTGGHPSLFVNFPLATLFLQQSWFRCPGFSRINAVVCKRHKTNYTQTISTYTTVRPRCIECTKWMHIPIFHLLTNINHTVEPVTFVNLERILKTVWWICLLFVSLSLESPQLSTKRCVQGWRMKFRFSVAAGIFLFSRTSVPLWGPLESL